MQTRLRSFLAASLLSAGSLGLLVGCTGKPENSPVIRKKFAEVDAMKESFEAIQVDIQNINQLIEQLSRENSELRAFMPDVDGMPALEKLDTIEARLVKLEEIASDSVMAQAASPRPRPSSAPPQEVASAPAPQGSSSSSSAESPRLATSQAAAQQQATPPVVAEQRRPAANNSFREMTNRTAAERPAPAAAGSSSPRPAAAPSAPRGRYHTIVAGENLQAIATQHGVSVDAILNANSLPRGARLARGQRLYIPAQ